ncbi:Ribosomal protein S12 methylthiotransferase RimO [bioreactor metagenome]|uniref:Ribosomal protein S12 methylthiotransferase RimO n=1 Tax=bioreactor metagenome TaxID=1076179 RepID=A0A645AWI8_9ZZZZ
MEPITIAVLRRLTPPRFECVFYDDRIEAVDFATDADIIAITVETYTAKRAYAIADRFRKMGKLVVMGGYHITMLPEDAKPHADIIVRGNAEGVWAGLLADIEADSYRPEYVGEARMDYGLPDRSIYQDKMDKYLPISLVEIGRGCHHNCEFCSIYSYFKCQYIHRSIEDIIAEIKLCKGKVYFFVDDSIFSDKAFAKELFAEVAKLDIIWVTQVTLDIAQDEELLLLMKKSGCELILIGFESIDPDNLKQMNKAWSVKLGERDELVERIHRCGISIYASFVFGFDFDNEQSFKNCLEFCKKHQFFVTAYNHLLAFPGTGTYDRFAKEGRLLDDKWWLQEGYTFGTISYRPKLLTPSELSALCRRYKKYFFGFMSIFERGRTLKTRTDRASIVRAYWLANLLLHFEVDKRYGIPLGGNLDEVRK